MRGNNEILETKKKQKKKRKNCEGEKKINNSKEKKKKSIHQNIQNLEHSFNLFRLSKT